MFNLIENLNKLNKEYGGEVTELQTLVETSIIQLLKQPEILLAENILNNLSRFDFLPLVKSYISECVEYAQTNHNKFLLTKAVNVMEAYNDPIYSQVQKQLKKFDGNENEIAEKIRKFDGWDFIPEVSALREGIMNHTYGVGKHDSISTMSVYSPTYTNILEKKLTFNLGNSYFDFDLVKSTITENNGNLPREFVKTCSLLKKCIVESNGTISFSNGQSTFKIDNNKLFVNNVEIVENHYSEINKGFGSMNSQMVSDLFHIWEQNKTIMDLDFVTKIQDTNVKSYKKPTMYFFNVKESNKTYLHIISGTNELFNETTLTEGVKTIKNRLGYDLTAMFSTVNNDAVKENERLNREKGDIVRTLNFLKNKKHEILESEELNATTTNMLKVLEREITTKQKELKHYHRLLGTDIKEQNSDDGYLQGKLGYTFNGLQKGLNIFVNAKMYENSKDDETVEIKTVSNSIYQIPKRMLVL